MLNLPVIVCIGTVRVMGDALGPFTGDLLIDYFKENAHVYGCTDKPVTGVNLGEYLEFIEYMHRGSPVIAVDASVGRKEDVGKLKVTLGGIAAGGALGKRLPRTGHIGVLGVVAEREEDNMRALMGVPYDLISEMSMAAAEKTVRLVNALESAAFDTEKVCQGYLAYI